MTLSLEEEIFISSGLLTDNYDPEAELEEGDEHLTPEERKQDLKDAQEQYLTVRGRLAKLSWEDAKWEVGGDVPSDKSLKIRAIFASIRKSRQEVGSGTSADPEKIIDGLPIAYALGDVRIYAEPKMNGPGDSFKRITINRVSPASSHEPMTREVFVEEIADEIRFQLRVECEGCSKPVEHDAEECPHCGFDLLGGGDDDGLEGEEGETGPGTVIDTTGETTSPAPTA
jgi:hypothetical protein